VLCGVFGFVVLGVGGCAFKVWGGLCVGCLGCGFGVGFLFFVFIWILFSVGAV